MNTKKEQIYKDWDEMTLIPILETRVIEIATNKEDFLISNFELDKKEERLYLMCDSLSLEEIEKGINSVFRLHLSEFDSLDEGLNKLYEMFIEKLLNGGVYHHIE